MTNLGKFLNAHAPDVTLAMFEICCIIGAFSGGIWAVAAIAGGLVLAASVWYLDNAFPMPDKGVAGLALGSLGVMALMNVFSTHPAVSWSELLRMATIFIPLSFWSSPAVRDRALTARLINILPASVAAGAALLSLELLLHGPIMHLFMGPKARLEEYNRGLSYLVVLSLPVMAYLWTTGRREAAVAFGLFMLLPASLTDSRASKLGLALAAPVVIAAIYRPRLVRDCLASLAVALTTWPIVAQWAFLHSSGVFNLIPASWRDRVEIWDFMSYRILEHPWVGWGLGTSRFLRFQEPHGSLYRYTHANPGHPHNVVTQLWVELGLPGVALGLIFALVSLNWTFGLDRRLAPFAMGAWIAALCLCLVAYNFWTDSLFSAFMLTGLAFASLQKHLIGGTSG